jgi:hypothetical protein
LTLDRVFQTYVRRTEGDEYTDGRNQESVEGAFAGHQRTQYCEKGPRTQPAE